jgi:hypothetical protein
LTSLPFVSRERGTLARLSLSSPSSYSDCSFRHTSIMKGWLSIRSSTSGGTGSTALCRKFRSDFRTYFVRRDSPEQKDLYLQ